MDSKKSSLNENKFKVKLPTLPKMVGAQYYILAIFWAVLIVMLITAIVLFSSEQTRVNSQHENLFKGGADGGPQYDKLVNLKYPLIDFSMLSFVMFSAGSSTVQDAKTAWEQRVNNITVAYSYIFITTLIAIIGLIFYIVTIYKLNRRASFEKHYNLSVKYPNQYPLFGTKMYLDFIVSLAIVFAFFNFLSTLIILFYGIILVLVSYFFWYVLNIKSELLVPHKWWKASNFVLFTSILLIQNGFNFLRSFFLTKYGVNLDLILQILFPLGTITVVIAILIRNLLSTKVTGIRNAIKAINGRLSSFRIFYYTQGENSLEDYTFVSQLPTLIRINLESNKTDIKGGFQLMKTINETATFFEQHFSNEKELKYMLYHLFNEITEIDEINEIKSNVLKVETAKKVNK